MKGSINDMPRAFRNDYIIEPDGVGKTGKTAADRYARAESLDGTQRRVVRISTGTVVARWLGGRKIASNPATNSKKKQSASKRIGAALSRWLKKQNPGQMKGVTHVRVRKLKGGGVTVTPVRHR
jgi:hypothetical protein